MTSELQASSGKTFCRVVASNSLNVFKTRADITFKIYAAADVTGGGGGDGGDDVGGQGGHNDVASGGRFRRQTSANSTNTTAQGAYTVLHFICWAACQVAWHTMTTS